MTAVRAELHVHLLGAIPPATLLELARRHRVALPAEDEAGLREWFRFRDFDHFQETITTMSAVIREADDLELITYAYACELHRQGVRYAEVMISPTGLERRGMGFPVWLEAMNRGRSRATAELGLELRWIVELNRVLPESERAYWADRVVEAAIAGRDAGVVALGLSGSEAGHPPEPFAPWFDRARAAGLHSVPHAGELAGPASIWGAVDALHAERIAHGVRAVEDPALVAHLAERAIVLDTCPTSNVCLGVYPSLAGHPLRRLHESGVPVTVNSDDPTMFATTLDAEIAALTGPLGLDDDAAREIVANGPRYGFAS
ncbi:MAG TPA: adenosine deaminase [Candidatus Dormibacteraeota bacterium]|nr:adenosine deaminase [Candidatus Dormibacteraeota bacterium]